jgi:Flp pilus assembly protein CpaB
MRRARVWIFVVLILIVGLAVGAYLLNTLLSSQNNNPQQTNMVEIYVAKQNIQQGASITEDVLGTISIPQESVVAVMFTRDELAQLTTDKVARFPLDQGVIITEAMIVNKSEAVSIAGPAWASLVPPGMTAISIPASRLSLAGFGVADGAHVNVNVCFLFVDVDPTFQSVIPNTAGLLQGPGVLPDKLPVVSLSAGTATETGPQGRLELDPSIQQPFYIMPSESQRPRTVCQVLLQDVIVLKVGNFPLTSSTATTTDPAAQQQASDTPVTPDMVTLIVTPQDSITLSYLTYTNTIFQLALRNPTDQSRQATEGATLQFLLSQYNIPMPAKLPYATQPRIDILVAPILQNDLPQQQQ